MNQILKKSFYTGLIGISVFEILNVFFIMPFPGSQEINSLNLAYFLYSHRWHFRIAFGLLILAGLINVLQNTRRWIPLISTFPVIGIILVFNFQMKADSMFKQPKNLKFSGLNSNRVNDSSLAICVYRNGEAKGYPVEYLAYHHQVRDIVGGLPLMITYCNVCRTGRAYEPLINGHPETFRLVGMDHYNAMFEDFTTKSWWRQATGEAVTGPLKGKLLPEVTSVQLTVKKLFDLFPEALVMQSDESFEVKYDTLRKFERGLSKNRLTRTDSISWQNKSWVIGIRKGTDSKAYDWISLKERRIINDNIGQTPVVIALSMDGQSFVVFERPDAGILFTQRNDTLFFNDVEYDYSGKPIESQFPELKRINAYQEFWHSWQVFNPNTRRYP